MNPSALNFRIPRYLKKLMSLKGEIGRNIIITGNFNIQYQ